MERHKADASAISKDIPVFTDIHCHCLPGFDDGPTCRREAIQLCRALVADRIGTVVATPHQLGRYDNRYDAQDIREAVGQLNEWLHEQGVSLSVLPGADVRIDERIGELLQTDRILTVADAGRYLMLELPHEVFIEPTVLLDALVQRDVRCVITHPERHPFLAKNPRHVERWVQYKPSLQITAASFLGEFGALSQDAAWAFLEAPLPLLVATDAHDTEARPPRMTAAYRALANRVGRPTADLLCIENPRRLLTGEGLQPISPNDPETKGEPG